MLSGIAFPTFTCGETEASSLSFPTVTFVPHHSRFASDPAVWLGEGKRKETQKKAEAELTMVLLTLHSRSFPGFQ